MTNEAAICNNQIAASRFFCLPLMKKEMRKITIVLSFMLLIVSCGLDELGEKQHANSEGIWKSPALDRYDPEICYSAGLDYPEGHDWKSSPDDSLVKVSLVMFADGEPVLRVPAGKDVYVSPDPSRHRILKGHLYTDYTDGASTVVKRDGKEVFRYEGAEEIIDMLVHKDEVHHLGRPRDSGGFCYRVNGEEIISRAEGRLFSTFREVDGEVCFFFAQTAMTSEGKKDAYYMVRNGKVGRLDVDDDLTEVWDIMLACGDTVLIASSPESAVPMLIKGGERISMESKFMAETVSCRFLESDELCVIMRLKYPMYSNLMADVLWAGYTEWKLFGILDLISAAYAGSQGYCVAVNPSSGDSGTIFLNDERFSMPDGYSVYTEDCVACRDSLLYVGLSAGPGRKPMIWRNGIMDTLDMNGPVTFLQ